MQNEEITETETRTIEAILEDIRYADIMIAKKPLFGGEPSERFLERKQDYREFREELLEELDAARA